jgi:hypothetical protein
MWLLSGMAMQGNAIFGTMILVMYHQLMLICNALTEVLTSGLLKRMKGIFGFYGRRTPS